MVYLLLSILVSVGIFIIFRHVGKKGVNVLAVVLINYIVAVLVGIIPLVYQNRLQLHQSFGFYFTALVVGILFMLLFLVVHQSTNTSGIAITSAAAKLSVVFPIIVSFIIDKNDIIYPRKIYGIIILIISLVLILFKKDLRFGSKKIYLPLLLFAGLGFVDSLIKFAQQFYIAEEYEMQFTMTVFFFSAVTSAIVLLANNRSGRQSSGWAVFFGVFLGVLNFGSLFFILKALNLNMAKAVFLDSSRIYMLNNIGIVLVSSLVGLMLYRERPGFYNYLGIVMACLGFYLII